MQFIAGGPDIPDTLLQAHEQGKVIFFCGAGISYPAGLPGFQGLVDQIYENIGTSKSPIEQAAYDQKQYDNTLHLLEKRIVGHRLKTRKAVADVLRLQDNPILDTHIALLQLAQNSNAIRLVTTNFDRLFIKAADALKLSLPSYIAPQLPIPKASRWDGIVYLHGLLPEAEGEETALQQLVITSGDFGLAYLIERWAARFVSNLFQDYVICFIGYSISDPVVRYIMDALAADHMRGEVSSSAYLFGSYEHISAKDTEKQKWEAQGVIPILYSEQDNHAVLHNTLKAWSEVWKRQITGKEDIIIQYAPQDPQKNSGDDNFAGRVLWALSDPSGLPAQRFAQLNPVPDLTWLTVFTKADESLSTWWHNRFRDENENVARPLGVWLSRHMNDPRLLQWYAKQSDYLPEWINRIFKGTIERAIIREDEKDISTDAAVIILDPEMYSLWQLLLNGHFMKSGRNISFYDWKKRFERDGLNASVRLELRTLISPKFVVNDFSGRGKFIDSVDLKIATNEIWKDEDWRRGEKWVKSLPLLLEEFQQLLCDALDLLNQLGKADAHNDPSRSHHPDLNQPLHDFNASRWVVLIALLQDAWLETGKQNPRKAAQVLKTWFQIPYPTFKRLCLWGASRDDCSSPKQWTKWLLSDNARWMWYASGEVRCLLHKQGHRLMVQQQQLLETTILAGPYPRESIQEQSDSDIFWKLAELKIGSVVLSSDTEERFRLLSAKYPDWRQDYSYYQDLYECQDFEENNESGLENPFPRMLCPKQADLVHYLKKCTDSSHDTFWRNLCNDHKINAFRALFAVAQENIWPRTQWSCALRATWNRPCDKRVWPIIVKSLKVFSKQIPDDIWKDNIDSISHIVKSISATIPQEEDFLLERCRYLLEIPISPKTGILRNGNPINQPVFEALNHPVGHITQALINIFRKQLITDKRAISESLWLVLSRLCNIRIKRFRHGRVFLSYNFSILYKADSAWTKHHLLPLLLNENKPYEFQAAWCGFICNNNNYIPELKKRINPALKIAAKDCEFWNNDDIHNLAIFLLHQALKTTNSPIIKDYQQAFDALPARCIPEILSPLIDKLKKQDTSEESFWIEYVKPFFHNYFPKSSSVLSPELAERFGHLCVHTKNNFPEAVDYLAGWFTPVNNSYYITTELHKSELCRLYPTHVLNFLVKVIGPQTSTNHDLQKCLGEIGEAEPDLRQSDDYKKLATLARINHLI